MKVMITVSSYNFINRLWNFSKTTCHDTTNFIVGKLTETRCKFLQHLINVIMKQQLMKHHLRTCCISVDEDKAFN